MSENQAGQHSYAPGYQLDPRLYDWPQNRFPSNDFGRQQDRDQGRGQMLPPISPYSTGIFPREAILNHDYFSEKRAYSHYEEHHYEQVFTNREQAHCQGPSPMDDSDLRLDNNTTEHESLSYYHRRHQFNDPLGSRPSLGCFCPICGAGHANKEEIRAHFLACVAQNGNPYGAYWDDALATARSQQSERTRKMNYRLNAVNGVVIPSKLAVGELPSIVPSQASESSGLNFSCPLCKGPFARMDHIKSHFPACVDRNGNPDGLRWNDGLPVLKRALKTRKS